ncbi:MAG: effector binding domain-containing protein [Minisyncoccota bacterium]
MEKYSHGAFQVTGYKITTTKKDNRDAKDIAEAWAKFMSEKMADKILHKAYPTLHMVYFNYVNPENLAERGYDMLMGFITEENSTQEDASLTTITIPAQDYEYVKVAGELPANLLVEWQKVNAMNKEECNRAFGYDMDMYNADMSEVTLTVSVNK